MRTMTHILSECKRRLVTQMATLHAVSPLATLDRGYAIATLCHHVLLDSESVKLGDKVDVRLAKGRITCEVKAIESSVHSLSI